MSELTPYYKRRAAELAAGTRPEQTDPLLPIDPAEFEHRYGHLPAYTEKSFLGYAGALVEKGMDTASAVSHVTQHREGMQRHLLTGPAGTAPTQVWTDSRDAAEITAVNFFQPEARAAEVAAAATQPQGQPLTLDKVSTDQELVALVGAKNVYSDASFGAYRSALLEKGFRVEQAEDLVEKGREGLTELEVTDRNGQPAKRWVRVPAAK